VTNGAPSVFVGCAAGKKDAPLAVKELMLADADVTRIALEDYPLPIYDADVADRSGPPRHAVQLKQLMASVAQGVVQAIRDSSQLPPSAATLSEIRFTRPGRSGPTIVSINEAGIERVR